MTTLFSQLNQFIAEKQLCTISISRAYTAGAISAAKAGERRLEWLERAIANIFSQLDTEVAA